MILIYIKLSNYSLTHCSDGLRLARGNTINGGT